MTDAAESKRQRRDPESLDAPKIRFRNYTPANEALAGSNAVLIAPAPAEDIVLANTLADEKARLTSETASVAASAIDDTAQVTIVPRKANWDLKRDLAPRLAKLEKKTQRAIAEIVRKRLVVQATASNSSSTVTTTTTSSSSVTVASSGGGSGGGGLGVASSSSHSTTETTTSLDEAYKGPMDVAAFTRAVGQAGGGEALDDEDEDEEIGTEEAERERQQENREQTHDNGTDNNRTSTAAAPRRRRYDDDD